MPPMLRVVGARVGAGAEAVGAPATEADAAPAFVGRQGRRGR